MRSPDLLHTVHKSSLLTYLPRRFPGILLFSEIYQVTGPVARFARQIAGQGYIVAAPSSYHDFTGPEALAYDVPGTDQGNEWKVKKVRSFPAPAPPPGDETALRCVGLHQYANDDDE